MKPHTESNAFTNICKLNAHIADGNVIKLHRLNNTQQAYKFEKTKLAFLFTERSSM